ncbi:DUF6086 family protein [Streptomyces sp. NPDC058637]|uniref:DUF6086 family protein n=1 Tax=Streptomyces sp. NPDC058637 TaxID=3346569 RepID=UPI00365F85FE
MSQYFERGDRTLWNPSNGAARLFVSHLAVYEAELGMPSGIGPQDADAYQVDPDAFAAFVHALLRWHRDTGHRVMRALSDGFVATALALAERAGIEVDFGSPDFDRDTACHDGRARPHTPARDEWSSALRRDAHEMVRSMAC